MRIHYCTECQTHFKVYLYCLHCTLTTAFCSTRAFTCSTFPDTTRGKMDESAPLQNIRYSPEIPQTRTKTIILTNCKNTLVSDHGFIKMYQHTVALISVSLLRASYLSLTWLWRSFSSWRSQSSVHEAARTWRRDSLGMKEVLSVNFMISVSDFNYSSLAGFCKVLQIK